MKNIEIREFKLSLENYISSNALPCEIKRMVLKEIYEEVELETIKIMTLEIEERDKQEKEQGER